MSESVVGRRETATRQNAGRPVSAREAPGGWKDPAASDFATLTATFAVLSPARLSHVAAWSTAGASPAATMIHPNLEDMLNLRSGSPVVAHRPGSQVRAPRWDYRFL